MKAALFKQLHELKRKKPFAPFWVRTTSGKSYRVNDRLQFAFTENLVCYADPKTQWFIEVKANDIASVEVIHKRKPAA